MQPWETELNEAGLINLFTTIPAERYDGTSGESCLVGFPIHAGVLSEEFAAYKEAWFAQQPRPNYHPDEVTWLAKRYHVDERKLRRLYGAVADYTRIDSDLPTAIEFAEQLIVEKRNFGELVEQFGLFEAGGDPDDDYDEDDDDYDCYDDDYSDADEGL